MPALSLVCNSSRFDVWLMLLSLLITGKQTLLSNLMSSQSMAASESLFARALWNLACSCSCVRPLNVRREVSIILTYQLRMNRCVFKIESRLLCKAVDRKNLLRMHVSPVSRIILYKDLHIAKCCMDWDVVENRLMLVSIQVRSTEPTRAAMREEVTSSKIPRLGK